MRVEPWGSMIGKRPVSGLFRMSGQVGWAPLNRIDLREGSDRGPLPSSNGRDDNRATAAGKGQVSAATRTAQVTKALVSFTITDRGNMLRAGRVSAAEQSDPGKEWHMILAHRAVPQEVEKATVQVPSQVAVCLNHVVLATGVGS